MKIMNYSDAYAAAAEAAAAVKDANSGPSSSLSASLPVVAVMILMMPLMLWTNRATAFPELVRHGYTQCTACHVSPAGGGLLTAYGRELSGDLLSTWSYANESQFLHSEIGKKWAEKGYLFGGDIRGVQTRYQDPNQIDGKLFFMQAELQGAYQTDHVTGVASVGQIQNPTSGRFEGNFNSTMYYALFKFTDEISVRAGRFVPAFGLNIPDHTTVIKQGLGFDPTLQFDSVEGSWLSEHWTILATAAHTVENTAAAADETVRTVTVDYALFNSSRVGVSYWRGKGLMLDRQIADAHAILGFSRRFYNLTEIDFEYQGPQTGEYGLTQFAYETWRGIIPYLQYQRQQTSLNDSTTLANSYGVGLHFFPRPHFELSGEWDRVETSAQRADSAYLMGHYYF